MAIIDCSAAWICSASKQPSQLGANQVKGDLDWTEWQKYEINKSSQCRLSSWRPLFSPWGIGSSLLLLIVTFRTLLQKQFRTQLFNVGKVVHFSVILCERRERTPSMANFQHTHPHCTLMNMLHVPITNNPDSMHSNERAVCTAGEHYFSDAAMSWAILEPFLWDHVEKESCSKLHDLRKVRNLWEPLCSHVKGTIRLD